jgi:hypothetical protein
LNHQCAVARLAKPTSEIMPRWRLRSSRCVAEVRESDGSKIGRLFIYRSKHRHAAAKCRLGRLTCAVYSCQADTVSVSALSCVCGKRPKLQPEFTGFTKRSELLEFANIAGTAYKQSIIGLAESGP